MNNDELLYGLDDKPQPLEAFMAALAHILASFVGIITPTLIIGGVLGLGEHMPYLISMALMVSGVGTMIQARAPLGVGAKMLCVQGTSFAFLSSVLAAGFIAKAQGGGPADILALINGVCIIGAFVEIILSQFIHKLKRIITPVVTGTVIVIIGFSLIKVGFIDLAGGVWLMNNKPEFFASGSNLFLGFLVMIIVITLNSSKNEWIRLSAIVVGLVVGFIVALIMGKVNLSLIGSSELLTIPIPFKFGFDFSLAAFIPIAVIYLITAIESSGDITANCVISKQPVTGDGYIKRIKNGVLGDGVNSLIAGIFSTFPNTTFSQNNGVIHLTGVASRFVGLWIGAILIIMGLFPLLGTILRALPNPVLGGATLVMFATITVTGIRILSTMEFNRNNVISLAVPLGLSIGVLLAPEVVATISENIGGDVGKIFKNVFSSSITVGGLSAIVMALIFSAKTTER